MAADALALELRLDRIEAELAVELPPHIGALARCYAAGAAPPPAPALLRRPSTAATAATAATATTALAALAHASLAARALALLRLVAPIALEDDDAVRAARAASPSWAALRAVALARDAAAIRTFGRGAREVVGWLDGVPCEPGGIPGAQGALDPLDPLAGVPARDEAWFAADGPALDAAAIERAWQALAARHGVAGELRVVCAEVARARTFLVRPQREVIVVVPHQLSTPAARFAALHELGHAVVALGLPAGVPRAVDEAAAAYVARGAEDPRESVWYSPHAAAARRRRLALARALARIEAAPPSSAPTLGVPWALWHDAGAQATYVAAEAYADALVGALGDRPAPGALLAAIAALRAAADTQAVARWRSSPPDAAR